MVDVARDGAFTASARSIQEEDRVMLTSVGIDIGSSTTQVLFSRLELERENERYVTVRREKIHGPEVIFTPYRSDTSLDRVQLEHFLQGQYAAANVQRDRVDTGALILTGTALARRNARAIGELFAEDAGRFVAVSAGDNMEATLAAQGSGAVALSEHAGTVMNIDIGGGATKVGVCRNGHCSEVMALDVGARLVSLDEAGVVARVEEPLRSVASRIGVELRPGREADEGDLRRIASYLVDQVMCEVGKGGVRGTSQLLRTRPLVDTSDVEVVTFSGGVSEYIYGRTHESFGDLGLHLGRAILDRIPEVGARVEESSGGIGATVVGASQYTVQLSGNTIFMSPSGVSIRNAQVVVPEFPLGEDCVSPERVCDAIGAALYRADLVDTDRSVALAVRWSGPATYERIRAFCRGVLSSMGSRVGQVQPLILVLDNDLGGLVGLHLRNVVGEARTIVSIDGIDLRDFDYLDIDAVIPSSGVVPVVIKSLVFSPT